MATGSEYKDVPTKGMAAYRAPSMLQPHKARQAFRDAYEGRINPLIGYFCGIASVPTARVMAQIGADIIWIDWEHSAMDSETLTSIVHTIQFMSEGRTMPFVRLPDHSHANIARALDAGASIIVPQVETVEEAKHVVSSAKFGVANGGTRGAPPFRLFMSQAAIPVDPTRTLFENLNDQAAIIIQIESEKGIRNLDAILTAVGHHIDCVWIGLMDLRTSMGLEGLFGEEPEFLALLHLYESTLEKHGKPNSGPAPFEQWSKGLNKAFVLAGGDGFTWMGEAAKIEKARQNIPVLVNGKSVAAKVVSNGHETERL